MALTDNDSFAWLGTGNAAVVEDPPVAEVTPTPEQPVTPEAEPAPAAKAPAVETETPKIEDPTDIPVQVTQLVDDLGGEESARQMIPLVRAIQEAAIDPDITPEKLGAHIDGALAKILDKDQYAAMAWRTYDKYGELMAEQYMADHPEFLQKFIPAKPEAPAAEIVDDYEEDEPVQTGKPSARELALEAQLNQANERLGKLEQRLGETDAQKAARSEQEIVSAARDAMFGTVVNNTFKDLGWADTDVNRAVKLAVSDFNDDQEAVKAYKQGVQYQKTQQPALRLGQVKASSAFATHLKNAIEIVGIERQRRGATPPVPPARKEISTTAPVVEAKQEQQSEVVNPFAAQDLLTAVRQRLAAKAAR